jgi:hypothetical protein
LARPIEAFLVPFRNALPPEVTSGSSSVAAPRAKPLWLVRLPGSSPELVKALAFRVEGSVIFAEVAGGRRQILQRQSIVGELPWFTDEELRSEGLNLPALVARYDVLSRTQAVFQPLLRGEVRRMQAIIDQRSAAAEGLRKAAGARAAVWLTEPYDPLGAYDVNGLVEKLMAAADIRAGDPALGAKLDPAIRPFHAHLSHLLAGDVRVDGVWISPEAAFARARLRQLEKASESYSGSFAIAVPRRALGAGDVRGLQLLGAVFASLFVAVGVTRAVQSTTWVRRGSGVALALAPFLLGMGLMGYIGASAVPAAPDPESALMEPVRRLTLYAFAAQEGALDLARARAAGERFAVTPEDLGALILARALYVGQVDPGDAERLDLAVRFWPGRIDLLDSIRLFGRRVTFVHSCVFESDGAGAVVTDVATSVAGIPVPSGWAEKIWGNLRDALGRVIADVRWRESYTLESVGPLEARFVIHAAPGVAPVAAPAASPTPVPIPAASYVAPKPAAEAPVATPVQVPATPMPPAATPVPPAADPVMAPEPPLPGAAPGSSSGDLEEPELNPE